MSYGNKRSKKVRMPSEEEKLVEKLIGRFHCLRSLRAEYETVWDEITDYIMPSRGSYSNLRENTKAQRRDRKLLDITGVVAARTLSSRVVTDMTGTGDRWFDFRMQDPAIDRMEHVRRFLYEVSEKAYSILQNGSWRLPHIEATADWVGYGTACMFVQTLEADKKKNRPEPEMVFKSIPVTELFIAEDFTGKVDTVFRLFCMPIRQVAQEFGTEKFEAEMLQMLEDEPDREVDVIHAVMPNEHYVEDSKMKGSMKYKSCYFLKDKKIMLRQSAFKEMPFIVFRFWKRTGEPYGGSPAWDSLSDVRMINVMSETAIRSFQLEAFPPMLSASDGVILPLRTMPNGVNIGGMSPDGKRLIEPMLTGTRTQMAFEVLEQRRQSIRNAFFVDPLINRETSIRTAAEVQKRAAEELAGISPFVNRYEEEYLAPILGKVLLFVLENYFDAADIPEEVQGLETAIEYTAPLARTQRARELDSTVTFLQLLQNVSQADPQAAKVINTDNLIGVMADLLGVPYHILKTKDELNANAQEEKQMQELQMMLQAGPALGGSVKDASEGIKNIAETAQIGLQGEGQP